MEPVEVDTIRPSARWLDTKCPSTSMRNSTMPEVLASPMMPTLQRNSMASTSTLLAIPSFARRPLPIPQAAAAPLQRNETSRSDIGSVYSSATTEQPHDLLAGPFSDAHAVDVETIAENDDDRMPARRRAGSTSSFESGRVSLFSRKLSLGMKPVLNDSTQRFSWQALDEEERLNTRRASELLKERVQRASISEDRDLMVL